MSRPAESPFDSAWRRRLETCESFEERWQSESPPAIADFLTGTTGDERRERLLELIRIDWEYRWRRGERRRIEEYAVEFQELGPPEHLPAKLIADEYLMRRDEGQTPDDDEWEGRFPGRLAELLAEVAARGRTWPAAAAPVAEGPIEIGSGKIGPGEPRHVGRYEIRGTLGRGGFATVYRAWDPTLCREVALKRLHAELNRGTVGDDRLEREARSAARLRHPAIVPIHEVGAEHGVPYIVYELIPGPTLAEATREVRPAPVEVATWVERLAEALQFAHQNGIIHRDVKPANILLDRHGLPTLADFGLALDAEALATLTHHGDILGTPAYMSPEQAAGRGHDVDGRSDVYSLGIVLYELLCGRPPFQGNASSVIQQVLHVDAERPGRWRGGLPADLETICLKAIAKEPRHRYPSAGAMADDLRAFLEHRPIAARRTGIAGRAWRWRRRNPLLAATLGVAVLTLAAVISASYWRVSQERDRYLLEREAAVANLYEALEREARALRLARRTGYRAEAWDRLVRALALETPRRDRATLRQEAIASLGDFVGNAPTEWRRPESLTGWISALAVHPRESLAAVAFTDVVQLRDLATGAVRQEFREHRAGVFALAFSADGSTLVSMDDLGRIIVRRRTDDQTLDKATSRDAPGAWNVTREIAGQVGAERHQVVAVSCFLSPDGAALFACSKGEPHVRRWNLATGEVTGEFRGEQGELFVRAALAPDGKSLVGAYRAADLDGVILWDVASRKVRKKTPVSRQGIVDVCFSGDGSQLACACTDGVIVLDTADWERRVVVRADDQFFTVAFHPSRPLLAVPNQREGRIRIWDTSANHEIASLEHSGVPHSVLFTPDGAFLLSAGNHSLRRWDLNGAGERRVSAAHRGVVNHVKFRPDGRVLASAGGDTQVVLHDGQTLRVLGRFRTDASPLAKAHRVAFSPDGRSLAVVDWHGGAILHDVADASAPRPVRTLLKHGEARLGELLFDVQYDADGARIAVAGDGGVLLWSGDDEPRAIARQGTVAVRFSADERRMVMRRRAEGRLVVWHADGAREEPVPSSVTSLGSFLFGADGRLLTFEGRFDRDRAPRLRRTDLATGTNTDFTWDDLPSLVADLELHQDFALSRDETRLALGGPRITVWDLRARRLVAVLPADPSPISTFDLSPDGTRVAVGLTDGSVVLWNLDELERQLAPLDFTR